MILQTFHDPVWTMTEVGAVYLLLILAAGFLIYNLFDSIVQMVSDFKRWLR
jgi:hypothetical protein